MQIVLIQAEIEKAIRNYVNSIVKVAEGVDIVIDLKSTRGDTGFTANIDLVEVDAERAAAPTPTLAPVPKAVATKANTESSDELAAAAKAKAAEPGVKKKSEAAIAIEQVALKIEQEHEEREEQEATAVANQATTDEPDGGITEPPFEPVAVTNVQETLVTGPETSEQPAAPRKPLFGRSNAALNA